MATPLNLTMYQGDTWSRTIVIEDDGSPMDLTGYTVEVQLRPRPGGMLAVDVTVDDTDFDTGVVVLSLTPEQTGALTEDRYHWDFQWTDPSGAVETLFYGVVAVTKEVTL